MVSREYYLATAEQCLQMAADPNTDSVARTFLRMLAADYRGFADAAEKTAQQQQQIQPKEPETDKT